MKRSELKEFIKGEIITSLSEASPEDVNNQKELNKELEKTAKLSKDLGLEEANIGLDDLQDIGYDDGEYAFDKHFNKSQLNNRLDTKYYTRGFVQAINDKAESLRLNENATPRGEDFTYDYEDIGQFYLEGFGKEHTLNQDQLGKLGKKITDKLYGGDIGKAYDAVVNPHKNPYDIKEDEDVVKYKGEDHVITRRDGDRIYLRRKEDAVVLGKMPEFWVKSQDINENEDDDLDAKAIKQAKGARGKHKKLDIALKSLKSITAEMKSLAREYSKADGVEKEKIKDKLKKKTPIKKELEAMVAKLEKNVV